MVSEKNDRENIQNVKTTNNTLYKPDLPILHVLNVNYLIESSTLKLVKIAKEIKYITCSVPQESIGTLLFSVYVIDLTNASRLLDPILFSYDSNLFLIIRTLNASLQL